MIKILRGKIGKDLIGKGQYVELSADREKELVARGIAEYGEPEQEAETEFLNEEGIRRIKKKEELINYAASIGMESLDGEMRIVEMQDAILNYQDELGD